AFVNINSIEKAREWFIEFQLWSKTTMPKMKGFEIKGKRLLFRELQHCIHSNKVKEKQGYQFMHNHVINSASSLSFWRVDNRVCEKFINLFQNGHSLALALHVFEDELYLNTTNEQKLLEILADRAYNPGHNGKSIFECLDSIILEYNNSARIYEKISQAQEICYMDASASFDPLNTSITLLYTSCAAGTLLLGLFLTSDEQEITIEKVLPLHGNNTNNYIEQGFGIIKDIIFTRVQAYNPTQIFQVLCIAKRFFCPGWKTINPNTIQKMNIDNKYLVPSTNENNNTNYIVNSEIGVCSCPVGMSGALCKHQRAVAAKFHISIFNFIPSLTPNDRAIYAYIALGYINQDRSFYALLHAWPTLQNQEILCTRDKVEILNDLSRAEWNDEIIETNNSNFILFLEEIRSDYQNAD
ncbi:37855_t:CDS:2, partial [Gigaspora margarita]